MCIIVNKLEVTSSSNVAYTVPGRKERTVGYCSLEQLMLEEPVTSVQSTSYTVCHRCLTILNVVRTFIFTVFINFSLIYSFVPQNVSHGEGTMAFAVDIFAMVILFVVAS